MGRVVDGEHGIGNDGDGAGEQEAIVLTKRLVYAAELAPAFANFALPSGKIDIVGSRVKASAAAIDGAVQASGEKLLGLLAVPPVGGAAQSRREAAMKAAGGSSGFLGGHAGWMRAVCRIGKVFGSFDTPRAVGCRTAMGTHRTGDHGRRFGGKWGITSVMAAICRSG